MSIPWAARVSTCWLTFCFPLQQAKCILARSKRGFVPSSALPQSVCHTESYLIVCTSQRAIARWPRDTSDRPSSAQQQRSQAPPPLRPTELTSFGVLPALTRVSVAAAALGAFGPPPPPPPPGHRVASSTVLGRGDERGACAAVKAERHGVGAAGPGPRADAEGGGGAHEVHRQGEG